MLIQGKIVLVEVIQGKKEWLEKMNNNNSSNSLIIRYKIIN